MDDIHLNHAPGEAIPRRATPRLEDGEGRSQVVAWHTNIILFTYVYMR